MSYVPLNSKQFNVLRYEVALRVYSAPSAAAGLPHLGQYLSVVSIS